MKTRVAIVLGLVLAAGCAADVSGGAAEAARDGEGADEVGLARSALTSCTVRSRSTILGGVVESLLCDGVACTRTCSAADPTRCSTRCVNSATAPRAQPALDMSILRADCRVEPNSRVNAGYGSITKAQCEARGSCWDNRTTDPFVPWCYEPLGKQPTCGAQAPGARVNAGFPGITSTACVTQRNACWDDRIPNVNWCFQPIQTAVQPPPDPSAPYRAATGDWNGDGLIDLYVARAAIPAGYPDALPDFVLQNDGRGSFAVVAPLNAQQLAALASWPPASAITSRYLDFNVDGIGDLVLRNVGSVIGGAVDQFVFGGPGSGAPIRVTPRTGALRQFFTDMLGFLDNREYFNTVIQFRAGQTYELYFNAAFLAALQVTFGGIGFASNPDFMNPGQFPHPVCNQFPSPCYFEPGFGWLIFARITFPQNIYDYSSYPATSIEAARIVTDVENDRASPRQLVDLIARIYLVPVGGDPAVNDIEPYDATRPQDFWIVNEWLQILFARWLGIEETQVLRSSESPIVELRAHRVGPFFSPLYHASVHLNVGTQDYSCIPSFITFDQWYSAFPSNSFGGTLTRRTRDKTDCPTRTILLGDIADPFELPPRLYWDSQISLGALRFRDGRLTYCALPELNVFCRGFNSNSFAFGLIAAFNGVVLEGRKTPGAPPITNFRFPGRGTPVAAGEFF